MLSAGCGVLWGVVEIAFSRPDVASVGSFVVVQVGGQVFGYFQFIGLLFILETSKLWKCVVNIKFKSVSHSKTHKIVDHVQG